MGMRCRIKRRLCAVPLAVCLLAAVYLLAALPRMAALARGLIDTGRECSLTVKTEILVQDNEEENADWSELNETQIQVYLYRVAGVNQYGEYEGLAGFEELELEKVDGTVKADDWRETARAAADILGLPIPPSAEDVGTLSNVGNTGEDAGGELGWPVRMGQASWQESMELPADLPDKLAGADAVITMQGGIGTAQGLEQGMYLVWVMPVYTDEYQYTFLPYLVSLPNNSYDASIPGSEDKWDYESSVGLKPRQNLRYGSLKIRKALDNYQASLGEAMFVFQVEARKDLNRDGEKEIVYSNVIGLEFNASGIKEAVIEHIPAGAEVTVEEIYSGSAYSLEGESVLKIEAIPAGNGNEQSATAEFTNKYDDRTVYGTGAINHFTYDGAGWSGERIAGNEGGGQE